MTCELEKLRVELGVSKHVKLGRQAQAQKDVRIQRRQCPSLQNNFANKMQHSTWMFKNNYNFWGNPR